MKTSLRFLVPVGLAAILFLPLTAKSQTTAAASKEEVKPKYDITGHWAPDEEPTPPASFTRDGKHVIASYTNPLYEHKFEGDYVTPTTIEGVQTRRKRSDNTTTTMHLTFVFLSPNVIRERYIMLDSNSDLTMGQTGTSIIRRVRGETPPVSQPLATPVPLAKTPPLAPPPEAAPKPVDPMSNID